MGTSSVRHLVVIVVMLLAACAHDAGPQPGRNLERCGQFRWSEGHRAIYVDVTIGTVAGSFQLDTGLDVTTVYGRASAKKHGLEIDKFDGRYDVIRAPLRIDGMPSAGGPVFVTDQMGDPPDLQGSVGMDAFAGKVLLIDYPARRLCLLDDLPPLVEKAFDFVPMRTVGRNRMRPEVVVNGVVERGFVFDTGSSSFAISLDRTKWKEVTHRDGSEADLLRWASSTWGQTVHVIGAPAVGTFEVGSLRVKTANGLLHRGSAGPHRAALGRRR